VKIEDILPALRKGKRARRPDWPKGLTVTFDRKTGLVDSEGDELEINLAYLHADDWELVPEPKKFKSWVKLYDNGSVFGYDSLEKAMESVSLAEYDGKSKLVETRIIEWEAPE
jgi:hypothetical protein